MKKYNLSLKAAGIFLAILLSSSLSAQGDFVTVKHRKGETRVKKHAGKVVIFDNGSLETFYALGIPVAGVPNNVPAQISEYRADKYVKLGSMPSPSVKDIEAFAPDLIIVGGRHQRLYDSLAAIAPTLLFSVDNKDFWNSFEQNVRSIASIFDKEKLADQKLAELRSKLAKVQAKTGNDKGKALVTLYVNGRHNPNGAGSRFGFPFDILGLKPAFEAPAAGTSPEQGGERARQPEGYIAALNPDYIFIIDRQEGISGKGDAWEVKVNDDIRKTAAYQNKKVFALPGGVWYLSGGGLISVDKQISDIGTYLYGNIF